MRRKKKEQPIVDEVTITVNEPAPKIDNEEDSILHYYRCNITMNNGQGCNCTAFM